MAYRAATLAKLDRPIEELNALPPVEWMQVCNEVLSLNLLTCGELDADRAGARFGVELELVPVTMGKEEAMRAREAILGQEGESMSLDQGCVELRTGKGGVEIREEVFFRMYRALKAEEGRQRAIIGTMHIHVDGTECSADGMRMLFGDMVRVSTEHGTHEVSRGISSPAMRVEGHKKLYRADVLQVESAALVCSAADRLIDVGRTVDISNLPAEYAYLKVLVLGLGERLPPLAKAALIRSLFHSKCFFNAEIVQGLIDRTEGKWGLTKYVMENKYYAIYITSLLLKMMKIGGDASTAAIDIAKEVVPRMKDEEAVKYLLLIMMEMEKEADRAWAIAKTKELIPRIKKECVVSYLRQMMEMGGDVLAGAIDAIKKVIPEMEEELEIKDLLLRMMEMGEDALAAVIDIVEKLDPEMKIKQVVYSRLLQMIEMGGLQMIEMEGEALTSVLTIAITTVAKMKDDERAVESLLLKMMNMGGAALTAAIKMAKNVVAEMKNQNVVSDLLLEIIERTEGVDRNWAIDQAKVLACNIGNERYLSYLLQIIMVKGGNADRNWAIAKTKGVVFNMKNEWEICCLLLTMMRLEESRDAAITMAGSLAPAMKEWGGSLLREVSELSTISLPS